ncbi:hypothetical protein V6N13_047652 [Hibiscus sabdariffa]
MCEFREDEPWVRSWESSRREHSHNLSTTTVFVLNFPPRLHWQGVWFAFARHGKVVDTFIPLKKCKLGLRFGFVRFSNLEDADRVVVQMNGCMLFGSRLTVSLARFSDSLASRKRNYVNDPFFKQNISKEDQGNVIVESIIDRGVIDKLQSCVIGTKVNIFSVERLIAMLESKGLCELEVRQVAGNQVLIDFDREELFSQCLNWEWEWLSEFFSEIVRWNEEFNPNSQITWVSIQGVPIFAWNNFTFNNLLNWWGVILLLEDEEILGRGFSVKRARILTNSLDFIEENVSLSCNGSCFTIKIREFNEGGWTSSVMDGFCVKKGDSINSLVKMVGSERRSPVGSSRSLPTNSKSVQFWNAEGFVYSRVDGGVVNESVLEPSNVLMKEDSLDGCSVYKESLTEVDFVLRRDKNYDARKVNIPHEIELFLLVMRAAVLDSSDSGFASCHAEKQRVSVM